MKRITVLCLALLLTAAGARSASAQSGADLFQQALRMERVDGDLTAAIALYQRILEEHAADRALSARVLVQLGQAYEKMGTADATTSYQRVLRDYADQPEQVAVARARLSALSAGATAATSGPTLAVRRVWAGADITGKVSADGRFLSFIDWDADDIVIRDLASGQNRRLTDNAHATESGSPTESTVPSPDGRSVAYGWEGSDGSYDLRVIGLDGSGPRVLLRAPDGVLYLLPSAWSPDGRHLLVEFVKADGSRDMMLVAVADGSTRLLKAIGKDLSPGGVFSPDGRYIAWATEEGVSLVEIRTGIESPLIADPSNHSVLGWAPDGRHILFSSARSGSTDAWLIAVADGKAQGEPVFVKKGWGFLPLGFTPSGAFYYGVNNNIANVQIVELDPAGGGSGSAPQPAFRQGNTWAPAWAPDGRSLAAIVHREPSEAVIIRSMDTGEERVLGVGQRTILMGGIRWTPDGEAVVFPGSEAGKGESLFRIDVQTGQVTALMPLPALDGWPRFQISRDGNTIFYVRPSAPPADAPGARLVAHDLRSGQETTLVEKRGLYLGAVSPDVEISADDLSLFAGESFVNLVVRDHTTVARDYEALAREALAAGEFVAEMLSRIASAGEEEKGMLREALSYGLNALEGRELRTP